MAKVVTPPEGPAQDINLREALEERYLAYALSTIMHRALPDVRDGLKPVHRRVLFAMRQLKLDPGSGFKKCARSANITRMATSRFMTHLCASRRILRCAIR